jgi:D-alanyl-D-alanine carboxypeptidase/D-alanyl-D-alanine-endopeptidase (penicillin-binding protein 4)
MGRATYLRRRPDPSFLDARVQQSKNGPGVRRPVRLLFTIVVLVLAALPAAVAEARTRADGTLQQKLARALAVPHVPRAGAAALAVDLATGRIVFARNGAASLAPASTEKLPVTYAALALLGPTFRFETDVLGEGEQVGAVWRGDVVLQGHGDPTLTSARLRQLAAELRAAGIRRISGSVVGDESWFDTRRTAAGWKPSFYIGESPPLSALAVDRARYGGRVSRDPALAAALLFRNTLRATGIAVGGQVVTGRADADAFPLAASTSATLGTIVRFMDRESDNFTAELLLKELGAVVAGKGTSAAGAAVVTRQLASAKVPLAGVRIVDGSGLSLLDRLTVDALVGTLEAARADPRIGATLLAALPVAGVNGTLEDRMRRAPARGNVFAKTGTTDRASALAGFVRDRYAFAVLHNGYPLAYSWARRAQDRFATVLAAAP